MMDLAATIVASLIFAGAALNLVAVGISEMHCYNSAVSAFRELALETPGSHISWFSDCKSDLNRIGVKRCTRGAEETLILGETFDE